MNMILISLGGNLGKPEETLRAALKELAASHIRVAKLSPFYRAAPLPESTQPWFINAVAALETSMPPPRLMQLLFHIEQKFGRVREEKNAARMLDLDLLDYNGIILNESELTLPHPRMEARAFVLAPLRDIAPEWKHPVSDKTAAALLAGITGGQKVERIF